MCTNANLELFAKALSPIRYMVSIYFFIVGCIVAGNIHLAQAFGRGMTAIGAFLIVCCFWNAGVASLMNAGMKRHNKFILLVAISLDVLLASIQLTVGSTMYTRTLADFSKSMQLDCLLKVPVTHTLDECLEFTRSDRYAAMMLVWRSYNYLSLDYSKYYQRLVAIEQDGVCCGFGPPTRCTDDLRDFPSWASEHDVGFSTNNRYVCGAEDDWYNENYFCSQYVDETAVFPVIGGCKYDFPMGDCMGIGVDVSDTVRGCAAELEAHMTGKILYHALTIMGLSALVFSSLLAGCCMFWKRAYEDSMPDHVDRHIPWDPYQKKAERIREQNNQVGRRAKDDGSAVQLDPLGVLIMGEMPDVGNSKIIPF